MADEICQSAAEEQMCIHRAKSNMWSGLSTMSQQQYLPLTVLLTLVANSLDDAVQGMPELHCCAVLCCAVLCCSVVHCKMEGEGPITPTYHVQTIWVTLKL